VTITYQDFVTAFPEFANTTIYPQAQFDFWAKQAYLQLNACRYGASLDLAAMLFVAHNLVLSAQASKSAASGGGSVGGTSGLVASKSVDKVSVSLRHDARVRRWADVRPEPPLRDLMTVKVTKDGVPALLKAIKDLTSKEVLVGIPDVAAGRNDADAISNAEIGNLMETGSPAQNIPPRPHLVPGVEGARDKIEKRLKAGAEAALSGKASDADATLTAVGILGENAVKAKITDGPFVPLSPKTIAKRKAKGRTGTKPLIDTSQYRRAITHVVRKKGES
jgi:hypothetical protein